MMILLSLRPNPTRFPPSDQSSWYGVGGVMSRATS